MGGQEKHMRSSRPFSDYLCVRRRLSPGVPQIFQPETASAPQQGAAGRFTLDSRVANLSAGNYVDRFFSMLAHEAFIPYY
jgi:hypothetical protein